MPKGLVVMEASATGADRFEPNRFRLIVTFDDLSIVDYKKPTDKNRLQSSEFYSADINRRKPN